MGHPTYIESSPVISVGNFFYAHNKNQLIYETGVSEMQGLKAYQDNYPGKQGLGPDTDLCRATTDSGS